jgi:nucleoside-diphosphate-sugar epimerase
VLGSAIRRALSYAVPVRVVVTGGAGFIGSNLAEALVARGDDVVVLDDLSTGYADNVPDGALLAKAHVADEEAVSAALQGADVVFHLAAQRAVPRSLDQPLDTDLANTHGTLTVLKAALDAGVRRVVYASSSSVYGRAGPAPTPEDAPTLPLSPYGVSKLAGEHYCRVFAELFAMETVALRCFNVFGPRQRPDFAYAAVIPRFIAALYEGRPAEVHGDGLQRRDFTFVSDVVSALLAAAGAEAPASGRAYNIAGGRTATLLELLEELGALLGVTPRWTHTDPRPGDIRNSHADVTAAARDLGWQAEVPLSEGLARTVAWFTA